jgi:hypothetical protein
MNLGTGLSLFRYPDWLDATRTGRLRTGPMSSAWEAFILPLNYTRIAYGFYGVKSCRCKRRIRQWGQDCGDCLDVALTELRDEWSTLGWR